MDFSLISHLARMFAKYDVDEIHVYASIIKRGELAILGRNSRTHRILITYRISTTALISFCSLTKKEKN